LELEFVEIGMFGIGMFGIGRLVDPILFGDGVPALFKKAMVDIG
jgi:hypothetical protein